MQNSLVFLVKTLSDLYILVHLLRVILQFIGVDRYNPLAEFIWRVSNPLVMPLRRILPRSSVIDLASVVTLLALECAATWLLTTLLGIVPTIDAFALYVLLRLVSLTLWFYSVSILIYVILSWVGQAGYSPMAMILSRFNEPILRPVRRILPPIAGLDLSPLLVLIAIQALVLALPLPFYLR
jgi:YggT family protein